VDVEDRGHEGRFSTLDLGVAPGLYSEYFGEATFASVLGTEAAPDVFLGGQLLHFNLGDGPMPPRNPELPEGTDHIINGALETGSAGGGATGGGATGGGAGGEPSGVTTGGGGSGSGFIGGAGGGASGSGFSDDTGGTAVVTGSGGQGGSPVDQLRDGASSIREQATTKVRQFADDGKSRATEALEEFSRVVDDAATSIDERLGAEYGQYARRAADAVSDFAETLRNKEVDELYEGAANIVRKSPAVAIGVAAAVGFGLVRLIKSGFPDEQVEVEFEPDLGGGTATGAASGGTGTTTSSGIGGAAGGTTTGTGV
jgi:ElaB/YqjD/DUF883 family membrane-anchored ribosome-binding protein